jgi:hypothetical protein
MTGRNSPERLTPTTAPTNLYLPNFPPNTNSDAPTSNPTRQNQIGIPMSSQRKINSARANGAKSRGPKTEAGKKASSQNAVTHGLYAKGVVLSNGSREQYQEMLDAYQTRFHPGGPAERDLLEEMVAAKWRQRRLWAVEADLVDEETRQQTAKMDEEGASYDAITPLSFAYAELSSKSLSFLSRNESRLERIYHRALKTLLEVQRLHNQNIQKRTESQLHQPEFPAPPPTHHDTQSPATANQRPETGACLTHAPPIR